MHPSHQEIPGRAQSEFFPHDWLFGEPLRTLINTAPTGVALFGAIRAETGQITDFHYRLANPIQRALTNHPEEDLLSLPLTTLSPDVVRAGMLDRLIRVVNTGQPGQHVEEYRLDGVTRCYDQLYLRSGDGVLMLVQDVTYRPLSVDEKNQQRTLLAAIEGDKQPTLVRAVLINLISGRA